MNRLVPLVVLSVLLAGCSTGVLQPGQPTASATTTNPTTTAMATATTGATTTGTTTQTTPAGTTTATPTTARPPDNQWGHNPVTIAVYDYANTEQNVTPLVSQAIAYWNNHSEVYAGVNVAFALVPNDTNPDIRLSLIDRIPRCGNRTHELLGCADLNPPDRTPHTPSLVRIRAGYSDRTTLHTIKHELGHVLGLTHQDRPQPLMNSTDPNATTLPQPNATDVPLPWLDRNITVFVDTSHAVANHEPQVEHALQYFEDGADGTLAVTSRFHVVANESRADIVIRIYADAQQTSWLDSSGSTTRVYGDDVDGDGALEYYTNATIVVAGIDNDASGWHVAYWLAYDLGYTRAERPPVLQPDATYRQRRSNWWV